MKARTATRLAWSLWGLTAALTGSMVLFIRSHPVQDVRVVEMALLLAFIGVFGTTGLLIASRRPSNPIGWLLSAMGLGFVAGVFALTYAEHALRIDPGSLPGGMAAGWVALWFWPVAFSPIGFVLLLFPDGRLPSRRWRVIAWGQAAALIGLFTSLAFAPGPMVTAGYQSLDNPLGIEGLGPVLSIAGAISGLLLLAMLAASALSLIVRFRRADAREQRQLKWFAFAGTLVIVTTFVSLSLEGMLGDDATLVRVTQSLLVTAIIGVPVSVGVAILKYRLYDIDVIINRTLVYGVLTAVLAIVYLGGVVGIGGLVRDMTGQERNNLVVAASTLAVAGMFRPARTRIQAFIDHRFYRRKYDAQQTIADFSAKMREQIDLDSLTNEMAAVVRETVQPTHVSVWLRS
jgi:hypothetical protein